MASPFLEVLTRCYRRPKMLAANQDSLAQQTDGDWIQTLLIDEEGRGVPWSYENMALHASKLVGQYIWILDDDDVCIRPMLVTELKEIAYVWNPEVIMVKMDHAERGILPDAGYWGLKIEHGHVGCSAFVVKRRVWQAYAPVMVPGEYASDFKFIAAIFADQASVYWHEVIASRVQRISLGRPE